MTYYKLDTTKGDERYDRRHLDALLDSGVLVSVEPCEHGKWDGHWPKRECHCGTNTEGEKGVWNTPWISPNEPHWTPCWHEPWCPGAAVKGET